jgi:hypothetical protein
MARDRWIGLMMSFHRNWMTGLRRSMRGSHNSKGSAGTVPFESSIRVRDVVDVGFRSSAPGVCSTSVSMPHMSQGNVIGFNRTRDLHRGILGWKRLRSSKKTLASVLTLYKVRISDDFEKHLCCSRLDFRGTSGGRRGRSFGLRIHSGVGLHVGVIPNGFLKASLEVLAVVD